MSESVVMLHGFGGTAHAFDGVIAALSAKRYTPLALDLLGHGSRSQAPTPITYERCVQVVIDSSPASFVLCGYSMGARIALRLALEESERVSRLVLVSATAGIEDDRERARRIAADQRLASEIEAGTIEQFAVRWRAQPMFADEPAPVKALALQDHCRNTTTGLATALRGIGQGQAEPIWDRLGELPMPVTVLAGERDRKYARLGARIADSVGDGRLLVVPGGHGLLLENPDAVAAAIEESE